MRTLILIPMLLCGLAAPALAQTTAPATQPFAVYDNLSSYTNKPDTAKLGWKKILTTGVLLSADGTQPDEAKCRQLGRDAAAMGAGTLAIIDIEHWPTDIRRHSVTDVAASIAKLKQATAWVRAGAAEAGVPIMVSHYALPVLREYHSVDYTAEQRAQWNLANEKLRELAEVCDVICPSLYAMEEGAGQPGAKWQRYAVDQIEQAKRFGKDVVPFIWWRWHGGGGAWQPPIGLHYVDSTDWRVVLQTVKAHCAGVVIWDYAGFNDRYDETGKRTQRRVFPHPNWALWRATREELP